MERPTYSKKLLAAQADDETTSEVIGPGIAPRCREWTLQVVAGAGVASGQVILETAPDPDYTGAWAALVTLNPAAANTVYTGSVTGCFLALRVRINTVIGGGTIDAHLVGN